MVIDNDVKVVSGANQRKILHISTSTAVNKIVDDDLLNLKVETEEMEQEGANKILEGIVISIDTLSLMVMHLGGRCSEAIEIE